MKTLFPFIQLMMREYKWLLLGLLLGLITVLASIGLLSLSGWFIAATAFAGISAITAQAFNYFLPSAGVRFFSLLRIVSRYGDRVVSHDATFRVLTRLRVWAYRTIEPLSSAYLSRFQSGDLLNRLVDDVDSMNHLYIRVLLPGFISIISVFVVFVYMYFFDMHLALWVVGILVFSGFLFPWVIFYLGKPLGERLQRKINDMRVTIVDHMQGMIELYLLGQLEKYTNKLIKQHKELMDTQIRMAYLRGLVQFGISLSLGLGIVVALYVGILDVNKNSLNGVFLSLIVLTIMASFEAIAPIPLAFQYLGKTLLSGKRLIEFSNITPDVIFNQQSTQSFYQHSIAFDHVYFAYEKQNWVLQNFSIRVHEVEKLGIVGSSGVGKSTLIRLLSRGIDPQHGVVRIGGVDIRSVSESCLRQSMSIISQHIDLFNTSIRENLILAKPSATDEELWDVLAKVQLGSFISALKQGLDTWVGEQGMRLSGGQKRRLGLARALLYDAPIWLLDEPTEGLDGLTRQRVLQELFQLAQHKTVIMVSHRKSDLVYMDRCVSL